MRMGMLSHREKAIVAEVADAEAAARDEAPKQQDLFVRQSAMGLPAAGRAHARDEISDRTDVFKFIVIQAILKAILKAI